MDTFINALKDTPLPTILVVAGIAILVLSIAGRISTWVEIPPERRGVTSILGSVLLALGIILSLLPSSTPDVVAPSPTPLVIPVKKDIIVESTESWQPSGIMVTAGQKVTINHVSGTWTVDKNRLNHTDAEGNPDAGVSEGEPIPYRTKGLLIARIGGGTPVEIGNSGQIDVKYEGELELTINDSPLCCLADNEGSIIVSIEVQ